MPQLRKLRRKALLSATLIVLWRNCSTLGLKDICNSWHEMLLEYLLLNKEHTIQSKLDNLTVLSSNNREYVNSIIKEPLLYS